jgi:hypothetical protein
MTENITTWSTADAIVTAAWGGREESAAQLADRLSATVDALAKVSPVFAGPWTFEGDSDATIPTSSDQWHSAIENAVVRDDRGEPEPSSGYSLSLGARRPGTADLVFVRLFAGIEDGASDRSSNRITLGVDAPRFGGTVDLTELAPVLSHLVETLVSIWHPDWTSIAPRAANRPQIKRPWRGWPVIGAITWLSDAVSDVPQGLDGVEVRSVLDGKLIGVPSIADPAHDTAAILAARDALVAASAIRQLPAQQPSDPAT